MTIANPPHPVVLPWRVVIDTAEQSPFTFAGMRSDASRGGRPIMVETVRRCLGRHPNSLGDYSLETTGGEMLPAYVERKSLEDAQATFLEYAQEHAKGRQVCRFLSEVENLAGVNANGGSAAIVVECNFSELLATVQQRGIRSRQTLAKTIFGAVQSIMGYPHHLPIVFAGSRRLAEIWTFRAMERYYRKRFTERMKEETR